jgi:hypothetical protein
MTCKRESDFWSLARDRQDFENDADFQNRRSREDILAYVIAKMLWLSQTPNGGDVFCEGTEDVPLKTWNEHHYPDCNDVNLNSCKKAQEILNSQMEGMFGTYGSRPALPGCQGQGIITSMQAVPGPQIELTYLLLRRCLRAQINVVLNQLTRPDHQLLGSSGLPCRLNLFDPKTDGDWDVSVRNLTRIFHLNRTFGRKFLDPQAETGNFTTLLEHDTAKRIQLDLIPVDGFSGEASYSPFECGNQENSTGSPQDRNDEHKWADETWDHVGDTASWLGWRLLLILLVLLFLGLAPVQALVQNALTSTGIIVAGGAVAAATAGLAFVRIPETENHRLMIESSRFLNNEVIIRGLSKPDGVADEYRCDDPNTDPSTHPTSADQQDVKEWLLHRMQEYLKQDFIEYNARPYQRYSLNALLNLADFACDSDVRTGATMVLDFMAAKFAVQSNQGRRLVPFRRRLEIVGNRIDGTHTTNNVQAGFFDLSDGADTQIGWGLIYAGQTQQLTDGKISAMAPGEIIYPASSTFRPRDRILDLTISKDFPYYQRVRHKGVEIYSSGPSYLISGGGVQTDYAYKLIIGDVGLGEELPWGDDHDRGAAVPTTVMFTADKQKQHLKDLLRFENVPVYYGDKEPQTPGGKQFHSYDRNICVWRGFACGVNMRIPAEIEQDSCFERVPQSPGSWGFLDSRRCASYQDSPHFYLVTFLVCRTANCEGNEGFLEIVDQPSENFESFKARVIAQNPPRPDFAGFHEHVKGFYQSASGHLIIFDAEANADHTGIESVDNDKKDNGVSLNEIGSWQFAEGEVITAAGDGLVKIKIQSFELDLDFSDWKNPTERVFE